MSEPPKNYSGCLVVGAIFLLGIISTAGSLWYRHRETRDALKIWGPEATQTIATPDKMEALWLEPAKNQGGLVVAGTPLRIVATYDVTKAPGFSHPRNALVLNRTFDLEPADCPPAWTHALRFTRGDRVATVALSLDCPRAILVDGGEVVGIQPNVTKGLKMLFEEEQKRRQPPEAAKKP